MTEYELQYTFKQGMDIMINVPVTEKDPDLLGNEVAVKLEIVADNATRSAEVQALLNAAGTAAGILGARALPPQQGGTQRAPGGTPAAPECPHGPMVWKEGLSQSSGKPYKGHFCAAGECKPQFRR